MAFETFKPSTVGRPPKKPGTASVTRAGRILYRSSDLDEVGIGDYVAVLVDRDLRRLAIRTPRVGEHRMSITDCTLYCRYLHAAGILRQMEINVDTVVGMYPVTRDGDMLVIDFGVKG